MSIYMKPRYRNPDNKGYIDSNSLSKSSEIDYTIPSLKSTFFYLVKMQPEP